MIKNVILTEMQIEEIRECALQTRKKFGVSDDVPIANDMRTLLDREEIILCEYPFQISGKGHLDAEIVRFTGENDITFIGLNTSLYYDEQIFAVAHELYHYKMHTGKAYNPEAEQETPLEERMADRFAAELLLPLTPLKSAVINYFHKTDIENASMTRILFFIASLQSEWWLPYQSIVIRLKEEKFISDKQFDFLRKIDDRNPKSVYSVIFRGLYEETWKLLNTQTRTTGISKNVIDTTLKNYEDGHITLQECNDALSLFGKKTIDISLEQDGDEEIESDEDLKMFISGENVDEG